MCVYTKLAHTRIYVQYTINDVYSNNNGRCTLSIYNVKYLEKMYLINGAVFSWVGLKIYIALFFVAANFGEEQLSNYFI